MSSRRRRPPHIHIYRTEGVYRRRRFTAYATVAVVAVLLVAVTVTLAHGGNDGGATAATVGGAAATSSAADGQAPAQDQQAAAPSPSPSSSTIIEIGWVGDTTPGSMYGNAPDNGRALFAQMRDELHAPDLMIANLEGTYSEGGTSKCAGSASSVCFAFQAPVSFARSLAWSGIDLVSLANNHSNDYFEGGLDQTKAALEKNDIAYAGLPDQVTVVDVKGVEVAVVAFSPYPWNANLNDIPAAQDLVRRARDQADIVVVLMHAGAEGSDKTHTPNGTEIAYGENRGDVRAFSHAVVDAGADLVLGSGPHVIRGMERYRGRLIAYSLGNFAGWDNFGISGYLGLSGLLTVKLDSTGHIQSGRWLSVRLADPGVPVVDSGNTSAHLADQLSNADFSKTWPMSDDGTITLK